MAETKLITIYAVGEEQSVKVDWSAIRRVEERQEREEGGPGFFYNDCAREITSYGASSVLKPQGDNTYGYNHLTDEDPMTAWVEGSEGFGVGDWFDVVASSVNMMYNGYQSSISSWENNSRVKKFKVFKDGAPLCYLELMDQMGGQMFTLPGDEMMDLEKKHKYRLVIEDIYDGKKWPDVAISEVMSVGCCLAAGTVLNSPDGKLAIEDVTQQDAVLIFDPKSGNVKSGLIQKQVQVRHMTVYELKTPYRSITLTADHPLYVQGYGFASLSRLGKVKGVNDLTDLAGEMKVKVWDQANGKTTFESIVSIVRIDEPQNTYSILKLDQGECYIANGFVTKTY